MSAIDRRSFLASALSAVASTSPSRKLRAAVIGHTGHGNYGHGIDLVWKAFEQIDIVAVADADPAGRTAAVKRLGAGREYADYREMLRVEKPDLVGIGPRWLDQRCDMVIAAAEAGAHIFTEKPFARDPADSDRMVEAVRKNKVKLQVAHQMRVSPYTLKARSMLQAGEIGDVQEIRVRGKEDRRAGGEDLMVLGSHLLDMLRFLLGDPEWVSSHVTTDGEEMEPGHAKEATEPLGKVAGNQIGAMFAFGRGVHGYFASKATGQTHPLRFGAWLYGSKGVLFLPFGIYPAGGLYALRSAAWIPEAGAGWESVTADLDTDAKALGGRAGKEIANALMVADLLHAIERNTRTCCNEEDGRWTIEMIHGIYQAQQTGARVAFPLKKRRHSLM